MTSFGELFDAAPGLSDGDDLSRRLLAFLSHRVEQSAATAIRPSALPVCGRRLSFQLALPATEQPHDSENFLRDTIAAVGTTMHATVQKWMGVASDILLGDWRCEGCGAEAKFQHGAPLCVGETCPRQNLPMFYVECSLTHSVIKLGHPDGALVHNGQYIGFEIKTKEQAVLEEMTEPVEQHLVYQTACYAAMFQHQYGLPMQEYVFFYFTRNLPWRYQISYSPAAGEPCVPIAARGKEPKQLLKIFRRRIPMKLVERQFEYLQAYAVAQRKAGKKLLPLADWGLCRTPDDANKTWCPYRTVCFSKRYRDAR